ncbi:tetratricopeptide repeat-containing hybrid sensor histidine kinase/response regulator [Hanstruepera ponticola]|uniref:tetratricopeptide repeat-containing hybrid sensor histidine kinase/response regulator n=1 Tax=Hanstruepera ponticola TaxID=2042995 RepID=UPI00178014C0|nr:ATP-binding protein [Hanstruepera ponticola]
MKSTLITSFLIFYFSLINAQEKTYQQQLDSIVTELKNAQEKNNLGSEISNRHNLFLLHLKNIDYNKAFLNGKKLEEILEKNATHDSAVKIAPYFYKKMGWLLAAQVQYERSIEYHQMAIEKAKAQNLNAVVFDSKGSIAFYSHILGKEQEAHDLVNLLMKEAESKRDSNLISQAHYLYYLLFKEEDNYQKALYHIKKSEPGPSDGEIAFRKINIGTAYFNLKAFDSAIYYTNIGLKIAERNNEFQIQSNAHVLLKQIYVEVGDHEKAMEHTLKFEAISEKSGSYKSGMELVGITNKILEEKINLQDQLTSQKIANQRLIIYINIFAFLVLLPIVFTLINRIKLVRKQKLIIENEKQRAEQSEKYKEQFLANMSHEIRTPMHAISGMTNSLLRNKHLNEQVTYLEAMRTSSDNLLVLLDDVLDLSKIESGKLEIQHVLMNPKAIIESVIKTLQYRAQEKALKINYEIAPDVPDQIIGDSLRLNQILINLVGNSIKFTDEGSIQISCSLQTPQTILFCVTDTGIGISKNKLKTIFNSFEQGEKSKSQIFKGTGLGLSISKKLVELQDGEIWVESEEGNGSQFCFTLPLLDKPTENITKAILTEPELLEIGSKLQGIQILLAEDDEFNTMVIEDDLNYFIKKFTLTKAKNGKEALEYSKSNTYDIILMDLHMPVLNGIEATIEIRKLELNKNSIQSTPILAMTANIVKSELDKCIKSGMNAVIPKPYKPEQLLVKLSEFFP